jgi:hypothetical protein
LRLQSPVDCIPHPYHIYTKCFSTLLYCGWAHECTLTLLCLCRWEWIFGKLGTWLSPSDVVRSRFKLQTPVYLIPHPYHIYTKCFSTLIYCGWAHGCILTLLRLCRWGWIFAKLGKWLSPSDVVGSWLRLRSPVDCIPHPYHINTKCFSTLIYCRWAHGCTLTLLRLCRWGWIFGKLGTYLSPSDVIRSWLRLQSPVDCIPHPFYIYAKCFSTLIYC